MKWKMNWTAMLIVVVVGLIAGLNLGVFEEPLRNDLSNEISTLQKSHNAVAKEVSEVKAIQEEKLLREQVVNLPNDQGWYHSSLVFSNADSPEARRVHSMFETTPRLRSLVAQTHFHVLTFNDRLMKDRPQYSAPLGQESPMFVFQDPTGKVIYKASGANFPPDGEQLADEIVGQINNNCPQCRPRKPNEPPAPTPNTVPHIEDTVPAKSKVDGINPDSLVGIVAIAGIVAGLLFGWHQNKRA
jgi:hypothetical protein